MEWHFRLLTQNLSITNSIENPILYGWSSVVNPDLLGLVNPDPREQKFQKNKQKINKYLSLEEQAAQSAGCAIKNVFFVL
jgi:hypothetical protein